MRAELCHFQRATCRLESHFKPGRIGDAENSSGKAFRLYARAHVTVQGAWRARARIAHRRGGCDRRSDASALMERAAQVGRRVGSAGGQV